MMRSGGASILRGLYTQMARTHARQLRTHVSINSLSLKPVTSHAVNRSMVIVSTRKFSTATPPPKNEEGAKSEEANNEDPKAESDGTAGTPPKSGMSGLTGVILVLAGGAALAFAMMNPWVREQYQGLVDSIEAQYPSNRALLPPILPPPYGPKYTVVVDLDTLVEYAPKNGGLIITKRAGVDYFLAALAKSYEVVLYSKEMMGANQIVVFKVDPQGQYFHHQLFKESGIKANDKFVDLQEYEKFNRDPSKVVIIDSNTNLYPNANVVCVGRGNPRKPDTILIDLAPILTEMVKRDPADIRPFVKELQAPDLDNLVRKMLGRPLVSGTVQPKEQAQTGWFGGWFGK